MNVISQGQSSPVESEAGETLMDSFDMIMTQNEYIMIKEEYKNS